MMTNTNYQYIEELLLRLLTLLTSVFTNSEKAEVQEFIDVGEYGLALETLIDIVIEEEKIISREASNLVYKLADKMLLDKKVFEERLRDHITSG